MQATAFGKRSFFQPVVGYFPMLFVTDPSLMGLLPHYGAILAPPTRTYRASLSIIGRYMPIA